MTAEAPEVQIADIQWTEVKTPETPAILPPPRGRHHAPEDSTVSTEDETERVPEDIREIPAEPRVAPKPPQRPAGRRRAIAPPPQPKAPRPGAPKISAPDFSEWSDFLGNFALKWVTRAWVAFVFRGIDRYELLSPQDNQALEMDEATLHDVAKPIAHMAERSKFGKRYGRLFMDSADGVAAVIQLTMWANRVSRIARKVREAEKIRNGTVIPGEVISEGPGGNDVPGAPFVPNAGFHPNGQGFN